MLGVANGVQPRIISINGITVKAVYVMNNKVWPTGGIGGGGIDGIYSCIAAGYWQDDMPWTDDLPWTVEV